MERVICSTWSPRGTPHVSFVEFDVADSASHRRSFSPATRRQKRGATYVCALSDPHLCEFTLCECQPMARVAYSRTGNTIEFT